MSCIPILAENSPGATTRTGTAHALADRFHIRPALMGGHMTSAALHRGKGTAMGRIL